MSLFLGIAVCLGWSQPSGAGIVMITGDDADDDIGGGGAHCAGTLCGSLFPNAFTLAISTSISPGSGILALGVNGSRAGTSLTSWNAAGNGGPGVAVTVLTTAAQIGSANFANFDMIYIPSVSIHTDGGMTPTQLAAVNARATDIVTFVNVTGGSLIALTEANVTGGWGWLPFGLTTVNASFSLATVTSAMTTSPGVSPTTTSANLSHTAFHNVFTSLSVASAAFVSLADAGSDAGANTGEPVYIFGTGISQENCTDGIDNDGDGLIDKDDPDCFVCGDGVLDPGEECDDSNLFDGDGCDSDCKIENGPCIAMCQDVSVPNDPGQCSANASIDNGSSDPEGDSITLSQDPSGPYPVGMTNVTLTCTDSVNGTPDTCLGDVTVNDVEAPTALCNAPATITPPDAPIMFTGSAADNCGATVEITGFDCFMFTKKGKRIDKTESCAVSIDGGKITILDSGGVGDTITWTVKATDGAGNMSSTTCEIEVLNPGNSAIQNLL